jgi:hypothetical protein
MSPMPRNGERRVLDLVVYVYVYVNSDGKQAMRLTGDRERLARQMAMSDDPAALLDALLRAQSQT